MSMGIKNEHSAVKSILTNSADTDERRERAVRECLSAFRTEVLLGVTASAHTHFTAPWHVVLILMTTPTDTALCAQVRLPHTFYSIAIDASLHCVIWDRALFPLQKFKFTLCSKNTLNGCVHFVNWDVPRSDFTCMYLFFSKFDTNS